MYRILLLAVALLIVPVSDGWGQATPPSEPTSQQFDLIIHSGHVIDGTGNPWFKADVGIRDGVITAVGDLSGAESRRFIDASGKVVVPGFIDIHSHADDSNYGDRGLRADDPRRRAAPSLVTQGITTVVVNQDGRMPPDGIAAQREAHERMGIGPNSALMVGHNELRRQVLHEDDYQRPSTDEEINLMIERLREEMNAGAFGLSAGLEYTPGRWSETDEVVALAEAVVPYRGVYISHQRSEAAAPMRWLPSQDDPNPPTLIDAVQETIEISERTGITAVASHLKSRSADYWGHSDEAIDLIQQARDRGVSVFADQYPYTTSGSDGNVRLLPAWAFEGNNGNDYSAALQATLDDPQKEADLRRDIEHEISFRGGPENIVVFEYPDEDYIGENVADLAAERNIDPVDMAIVLQQEGFQDRRGGARLRAFSMLQDDLDIIAAQQWVATTSDGGIAMESDEGSVHARFYGTFPRKIRHYALDRNIISLEDAIRTSTSLPAQIMGFRNRGQIHEGFWADVVVMDLDELNDTSTFFEPHQYSAGIEHVLVSGNAVVENGEPTWELPGRVLTPQGAHQFPAQP